jgi:chromosome segregation ATPase
MSRHAATAGITIALALGMTMGPIGCSTTYYKTMEMFGQEKRDILTDRVEAAREDQEEAKEQFKSALEQFTTLVNYQGGELEATYNQLSDELADCESQADDVRDRIDSIEKVGGDLFAEWEAELDQYTNPELRRSSEQQLRDTRTKYDQLIAAMHRAEEKMEPVLAAFRDQVLFLKHNLNAQAIASLEGELASIESNVADLIREMEKSIAEADSFITSMGKT